MKPEKTASVCVWTEPDTDALVQRFPTDYRSYLFRGLYFSSFAPLNEESLKPAIENLSKAAELNAKSALPQLFKAEILGNPLVFYKRLNQLVWGDAERDKLDYGLLSEYEKALSLDPNLLPALSGRALAHFHLKHFQNAIADYDKILSHPQDATTYNDRHRLVCKLRCGGEHSPAAVRVADRRALFPKHLAKRSITALVEATRASPLVNCTSGYRAVFVVNEMLRPRTGHVEPCQARGLVFAAANSDFPVTPTVKASGHAADSSSAVRGNEPGPGAGRRFIMNVRE